MGSCVFTGDFKFDDMARYTPRRKLNRKIIMTETRAFFKQNFLLSGLPSSLLASITLRGGVDGSSGGADGASCNNKSANSFSNSASSAGVPTVLPRVSSISL